MLRAEPVDGDLDFAAVRGFAAGAFGVVGAAHLYNVAIGIFVDACAPEEVAVAQAHFAAWCESEKLGRCILHEVGGVDVEFAGEGELSLAKRVVCWMEGGIEPLDFVGGVVFDENPDGVKNAHDTGSNVVEVLPDTVLQKRQVDDAVAFIDANAFAEAADGLWGEAPAAQAGNRRHAGIVPTLNKALFDQGQQAALAHDGVSEVELGKLDLLRVAIQFEGFDEPVIKDAVIFKFERADRVGNVLDGIRQAVRKIVHGIDAPRISCAMVRGMLDAVDEGVSHVHVGMRHVDFGAQYAMPFGKLPLLHAIQESEALFGGAIAVGAWFAWRVEIASILADLFWRQFADIGFFHANKLLGPEVELIEVVGGIKELIPLKAKPADVFLDGFDILNVFFDRVCVVKAQVACAVKGTGQAKIEAYGFGMADVQVAVGFRRETRGNASAIFSARQVIFDDFTNKV